MDCIYHTMKNILTHFCIGIKCSHKCLEAIVSLWYWYEYFRLKMFCKPYKYTIDRVNRALFTPSIIYWF